jgi:hypothetical protein
LETTLDRRFSALPIPERELRLKRLLAEFAVELYGVGDALNVIVNDRLELLGRHHGLPTTVLDWSRSPYVAAYFAFADEPAPASGRVAIWSFNRTFLAVSKALSSADLFIDDRSLVSDNVRALQQRGVFVRLPVGKMGEDLLSDGLVKYTIPYTDRALALNDLDQMLITATSLFRDRDAAARTATIREAIA